MKYRPLHVGLSLGCLLAVVLATTPVAARTTLRSICRVKGQEENTLQGLGIVVGLKGTGDGGGSAPTVAALAKIMAIMGQQPSSEGMASLAETKNVALVTVTATVPAAGARQGDKLDCIVSSVGTAKSLEGGRLFLTPLMGPDKNNPRIYAFCQGPISLDTANLTTTGRIYNGCQLETDFFNVFTKDGKITLVLDKNHADFQVAQDVAELINSQLSFGAGGIPLAKALNQVNIEVLIPSQYRDDPVLFVSMVMALPMLEPQTAARVVINERAGSIVIGGDVEIGAVAVTHKNVVIETTPGGGANFVPMDPGQTGGPKLKSLVEALNAVQVPTKDIIDIIKGLARNGKLHGQLIIE